MFRKHPYLAFVVVVFIAMAAVHFTSRQEAHETAHSSCLAKYEGRQQNREVVAAIQGVAAAVRTHGVPVDPIHIKALPLPRC